MKLATFALISLSLVTPAFGRSAGRSAARTSSRSASRSTSTRSATHKSRSPKCTGCARDSHRRIQRNAAAKRVFRRANPCPATGKTFGACPGYVIDHLQPLKRGGADAPGNMQWQSTADAKAKDRLED